MTEFKKAESINRIPLGELVAKLLGEDKMPELPDAITSQENSEWIVAMLKIKCYTEICARIFAGLTTEQIIKAAISGTKIMARYHVELSPEYNNSLSAIERAISENKELKEIVSDVQKLFVEHVQPVSLIVRDITKVEWLQRVKSIEAHELAIRSIKEISVRFFEASISETLIRKVLTALTKITITTITGAELDEKTTVILKDAIEAMAPKRVTQGIKKTLEMSFERLNGIELDKTETPELLTGAMEVVMREVIAIIDAIAKQSEAEERYILFGEREGEIPFTIVNLGKLNYFQSYVVYEEIFRRFDLRIHTLNPLPIILSESVLLDRLCRRKLSEPSDEIREHLKPFARICSFFIDYTDMMRWLHGEINFSLGFLHNPLGISGKLHSFLKKQKLPLLKQRELLQIYTRIAKDVSNSYGLP